MYCNNCGTQNPDGATFCTKCGAFLASQQQPTQQNQWQPQQQPVWQNPQPAAPALSMSWHKFLIFFALWASCILNIISGITALTGVQYEIADSRVTAEMVYTVFPSLKTWDVIYGILLIALGALALVTRFQLAGFKARGPKLLYATYIANTAAAIIYVIAVSGIVGENMADSGIIANIIVSIVMVGVNAVYYGKRKAMFVN